MRGVHRKRPSGRHPIRIGFRTSRTATLRARHQNRSPPPSGRPAERPITPNGTLRTPRRRILAHGLGHGAVPWYGTLASMRIAATVRQPTRTTYMARPGAISYELREANPQLPAEPDAKPASTSYRYYG